ncbi:hypothetical protein PHLGIDRAFT_123415 [Phlebiopsis gigantea 11061_1 CR5-6]|uniref:BTB domain-containing protein n=1 Tax=Phlebiopsis gigantea (strain 11061_1 CR5-6) TaxID=745531 RepID=A0A0C3S1K4_PHLG1|nr:hypothetical protein PHLGIDRAFT_123415 [Phlebiopsis gigantea 11061_1 CR5-6]
MSSSDTPVTASPSPLFNEGDIVIRSCDGQDFLMYKVDLSRASPFFKTFPALATGARLQEEAQDAPLPVVALLEPASVLTTLLSLCTPKRDSNVHLELASVAHILEAAGKYGMEWQVALARERMRELAETEPIQVYALACRFRLRAEAAFAARRCLRLPMDTILACETEEQDFVTAVQFRRLLDYRDRCQRAVEAYLLSGRIYEACRSFESYDACTMQYYHGHGLGRGWQEAYVNLLLRVFRDCIWEGAVRLEDIVSVQMDLLHEICARCSAWGARMETLRERIASEIAQTISEARNPYLPLLCID